MDYLIDASVVAAWVRHELSSDAIVAQVGHRAVAISVVSAAELLEAAQCGSSAQRRWRRQAFVESLLSNLPVLPLDTRVARMYSHLLADQRPRGTVSSPHTLIVAATALTHELVLATCFPERFSAIEGLDVTCWNGRVTASPRPHDPQRATIEA